MAHNDRYPSFGSRQRQFQFLTKKRSRSLSPKGKKVAGGPTSDNQKSLIHSKTDLKIFKMDTSANNNNNDNEQTPEISNNGKIKLRLSFDQNAKDNNNLPLSGQETRKEPLQTPSSEYHTQLTASTKSSPLATPSSNHSSKSDRIFFDKSSGNSNNRKPTTATQIKNFLAPNFNSRNEEFKRLFKAPDSEKFIIAYSCAYQREILCQGRMYISQNLLCFYANIFTWETTLVAISEKFESKAKIHVSKASRLVRRMRKYDIKFLAQSDIDSIRKKKTAKVIPNAIQVTTRNGEKLFFTSFTARSKTYVTLTKIHESAMSGQSLPPDELWCWVNHGCDEYNSGSQDENDADEDHGLQFKGSPRSCTSCDTEPNSEQRVSTESPTVPFEKSSAENSPYQSTEQQNVLESTTDDGNQHPTNNKPRRRGPSSSLMLNIPSLLPRPEGDISDSSENDAEIACSCESHLGKEVLNEVFPVSVDQLFLLIFSDNPSYRKLEENRKTTNLVLNDWDEDKSTGAKIREITYTAALNNPMGPKTCGVEEKQICSEVSKSGQVYVVKCVCHQVGIPYGDTFDIGKTFCMSRVSSNKCRLRAHGGTIYRKSCWGIVKSIIEKNAAIGINGYFNDLVSHLRTECSIIGSTQRHARKRGSIVHESLKVPKRKTSKQHNIIQHHKQAVPVIQQLTTNPKMESLIKTILLILIAMLILNSALFYKLWYFEAESERIAFESSIKQLQKLLQQRPEVFSHDWMNKMKENGVGYRLKESKRFTDRLTDTISAVGLIENSLTDLKRQIKTMQHEMKKSPSLI